MGEDGRGKGRALDGMKRTIWQEEGEGDKYARAPLGERGGRMHTGWPVTTGSCTGRDTWEIRVKIKFFVDFSSSENGTSFIFKN